MTSWASCPACRLRFELVAHGQERCSDCDGRLVPAAASELIGHRLGTFAGSSDLATAIALAAALPDPSADA